MAVTPDLQRVEALSRADLTWLHADEPTNHFVVTSLALFDEPLDPNRYRTMLSRRIAQHPRLRQVVTEPWIPFAPPRWTPARDFDLDAHLHRAALVAPGGAAELSSYIGDLVGRPLDPDRPLWESHIVDRGAAGGALVTRFHHSLGDGLAMVKLLLALTDNSPAGWSRRPRLPQAKGRSGPTSWRPRVPDLARLALKGIDSAGTLARLTLLDPDPPTPLRGKLTLVKRVAWSEPLNLAEIRQIAHGSGTTVNDVIVSLIAGALGAHLRARGEDTRGQRIRAMVPVNLRAASDRAMSGNRFSLVYLDLPVGVTDPRERLMRVSIEMDRIKTSLEPAIGWLLVQGLSLLPARLEHMTSAFYAAKASLVLSNVIGPAQTLYLAGSPIRQMTFWEPESGGLGVGLSIFSYAGEVTVGVVSDRHLVDEPSEITSGVVRELARLVESCRSSIGA